MFSFEPVVMNKLGSNKHKKGELTFLAHLSRSLCPGSVVRLSYVVHKLFSLNGISSLTTGPNFILLHMNGSYNALFQNCINGFAPLKQDGRQSSRLEIFQTTSPPERLAQIQNRFTELFLIMPSTKIEQMVSLC